MIKKVCVLGVLVAFSGACGGSSKSPTSPSVATSGATAIVGATDDPVTLKATAPTPTSPIDNVQVKTSPVVLMVTDATASYVSATFQYRFQVIDASGVVVDESGLIASGGGSTSYEVQSDLEGDKPYSWRARAELDGHVGPWSTPAGFVSPLSKGYISMARGYSEVFDPLTGGETAGRTVGSVSLIKGLGAKLNTAGSYIYYDLPATLEEGEFSLMVTGIDEGSPGVKTKVMSMMEVNGVQDLTTNDYRFTVEKRGRDYSPPGVITFRIITGDSGEEGRIHDSRRFAPAGGMTDSEWYFFKASWGIGWADVEVRRGSPSGPQIWHRRVATPEHAYRPERHRIMVGAQTGRAGPQDASIPGMIAKDVWVSQGPRPNFPGTK
jgi:hypothetical protein